MGQELSQQAFEPETEAAVEDSGRSTVTELRKPPPPPPHASPAGNAGQRSDAAGLGRSHSNTALDSLQATSVADLAARHSRAATWQHRGQRQRPRVPSLWTPNRRAESDNESDTVSEAGSCSSGMKRTFTESSDCSALDAEEAESLDGSQPGSGSGSAWTGGTWPRIRKRSSRNNLLSDRADAMSLWDTTRALQSEKTSLAQHLAANVGTSAGVGGQGEGAVDPAQGSELTSQLQRLVDEEESARTPSEDVAVDDILGALLG